MELTCTKCLLPKSLGAFYKKTNKTHGRSQPCKQCRCEARAANIEKARARERINGAASRAANPERAREKSRTWRAANIKRARTHARISAAKCRAADPEKDRAKQRERYAANPDKARARQAARLAANPSKVRAQKVANENRRRARKAEAAIIDLTDDQFLEICQAFNFRCAYCPETCWRCRQKKHKLTQDHITAVANGGNYTLHNIVPACRSCNAKKHTNPAPVYVQPLLLTVAPSKKKG